MSLFGQKRKNYSVALKYFRKFLIFWKRDEKFQCGTEIFQFKKVSVEKPVKIEFLANFELY